MRLAVVRGRPVHPQTAFQRWLFRWTPEKRYALFREATATLENFALCNLVGASARVNTTEEDINTVKLDVDGASEGKLADLAA